MLLHHFKLREQPFGVTPDPRFLFASATHREALASLIYGIQSGLGFVALTAEPGMGKTTLLFEALSRMKESIRIVFLFQTISTPEDLIRALLIDLGITNTHRSLVELQSELNEFLVKQSRTGKRLVVAIDEAQNLSGSVLEAVRMLSNFETAREKLMQIILSGQPQLEATLALPQMLQLRQRISIFARLKPLSEGESIEYIQHRLQVSGQDPSAPIFTKRALTLIARSSEGIPRRINNICFNAMSLGCACSSSIIDVDAITEVVADLRLPQDDASVRIEGHAIPESTPELWSTRPPRVPFSTVRGIALTTAASLLVLFLGWMAIERYRPFFNEGLRSAGFNATSSPAAAPAVGAQSPGDSHRAQLRVVTVRKGQSLTEICVEMFGECRPEVLRGIVNRNPLIHDPNHIEPGQSVVLPSQPFASAGVN